MDHEPKGGRLGVLLLGKLVCCGGLILVATGAASGVGAWLLEGGLIWLLLAAAVGVPGGYLLRRRALLAETGGEPRTAPTKPSQRLSRAGR